MLKALCGNYPCDHICSRIQHCPAGEERVRWYALFDKASRVVPAGVNPFTGEIVTPKYDLLKLNHLGENVHHASFTPIAQVGATPPSPAPRRSLRVSLDKLVSEAGFPEARERSYGRLYSHGAAYFVAGMIPKKPASRKVRIIVLIVLAVLAALIIWGSFTTYHYEPSGAQVGQTYNNEYEYDR